MPGPQIGQTISSADFDKIEGEAIPVGATISAEDFDKIQLAVHGPSYLDKLKGISGAMSGAATAATSPIRGMAKGFTSTALGGGELVERAGGALGDLAFETFTGKTAPAREKGPITALREKIQPKGIGEQIGFGAEQIAELFLPVPGGAKAKLAASAAEKAPILARALGLLKTSGKEGAKFAAQTAIQSGGDVGEVTSAGIIGAVTPVIGPVIKTPLTKAAEKLYGSALKPGLGKKTLEKGPSLIKTGLDERVFLTQGGVEKVAQRIDEFENLLGEAIETQKKAGQKISTAGITAYLDEAKKFFADQVDVKAGEKAIKQLDDIGKKFIKRYGDEMPLDVAQQVKVNTGRLLREQYGKLSGAEVEGMKQGTRFLKEEILKKAPEIGDINRRLKSLYEFDQALTKAQGRLRNLNLLGFGVKFGAAAAGKSGAIIGLISDMLDRGVVKSGMAIGINELGKLAGGAAEAGRIPLNALLRLIASRLQEEQE